MDVPRKVQGIFVGCYREQPWWLASASQIADPATGITDAATAVCADRTVTRSAISSRTRANLPPATRRGLENNLSLRLLRWDSHLQRL